MRNLTSKPTEFQDTIQALKEPGLEVLSDVPLALWDDLRKIQSAWGVPAQILIREMFEDFISEHWDLRHDKPKKLRWQREVEKKARKAIRAKKKKLLTGGYYE